MNDIEQYLSVQKWLTLRASTQTTKNSYISKFRYFLKITKLNPDVLVEEWKKVKYNPIARQKFIDELSETIQDFYCYVLNRKTLAELTKRNTIMVVKSFFKFHKIPLEIDDPAMKATVTFHNRSITKEEIRKILDVSGPREKAFFIMMVETGLRPDTLVKLQYKHIKTEYEQGKIPMKIDLPAQLLKDRVGDRFTFLGEDGYKILKTYLDTLGKLDDEDYIFQPEKKSTKKEPLPPTTFSNYFRKMALKMGIVEKRVKGKPLPVRLYCLRKYFRNNCRLDPSIREFLMGHSLGTDEHYIARDVELYRQMYAKNYETLRIYEKPSLPQIIPPEEFKKMIMEYLKTSEGQELLKEAIMNTIVPSQITKELFMKLFGREG
jgi:integrase